MQLAELVDTAGQVAARRGRKAKIETLSACLAHSDAPAAAAGLLAGEPRQGKVGIGPALIRDSLRVPPAGSASLTLAETDAALDALKAIAGAGANRRRAAALADLLGRATAAEQDFLRRVLLGELRQGALESLVVAAVAQAARVPPPLARRARMLAPSLGAMTKAAFEAGAEGLAAFQLQPMQPVQPMLAGTAEDLDDAMARIARMALELKLDGARIQVHKDADRVRVYTRRLNDVTAAVPEVVEAVAALPCQRLVLDGEAIALRADGRPLPFQITMRRFGRRLDVAAMRAELPLTCQFFDCLLLDTTSLLEASNEVRVAALERVVPVAMRVPRTVAPTAAAAEAFLAAAFAQGHEGVMVKDLDAAYQAGSRGGAWLKLKQVHTLDLVVLAAEWGSGRRRGWLSNLHLGARDPTHGGFVMLGKTFKGMTDSMLAWQTERLQALAVPAHGDASQEPAAAGSAEHPRSAEPWPVRVRPELVVEVAFNDVQTSPHYPAGLALRFARIKAYREDKQAAEADTIDTVRAIHARALA